VLLVVPHCNVASLCSHAPPAIRIPLLPFALAAVHTRRPHARPCRMRSSGCPPACAHPPMPSHGRAGRGSCGMPRQGVLPGPGRATGSPSPLRSLGEPDPHFSGGPLMLCSARRVLHMGNGSPSATTASRRRQKQGLTAEGTKVPWWLPHTYHTCRLSVEKTSLGLLPVTQPHMQTVPRAPAATSGSPEHHSDTRSGPRCEQIPCSPLHAHSAPHHTR